MEALSIFFFLYFTASAFWIIYSLRNARKKKSAN